MKKFQIFILGILAAMFFISCNNAAASSGNEKKQKYSIEYVLNGGAWAADYEAPAEYTEGIEIKLPDASKLTRTAYTFAGWYETTTFTGSPVTTLTKEAKGNKKFYAKWSAISYTITLASTIEGGTVTSDKASAAAGETVTLTAAAAAGYEFKAWLVKDSSGTAVTVTNNTFTMPASNVTVENPFALEQKYSIIVKEGEEVISEFYEYTLTKHFQVEIFSESRVKSGTTVYAWVLTEQYFGIKVDVISEGCVINPDIVADKNGGTNFKSDYEENKYSSILITFEMPSNDVTIDLSRVPYYRPLNEINESAPYCPFIIFGEWPQTKLTDTTVTVNESDSKEAGQFTYYKGSDNAWYAKLNSDYYKVEPIKWRILTTDYNQTGKKLLFAENVLTKSAYYDISEIERTINSKEIYPNNYEHSRVRALLNGLSYKKKTSSSDEMIDDLSFYEKGFLQTAFTEDEQKAIAITTVVNNARSTNPMYNETFFNNGENYYASDISTNDKIFLLSTQEISNDVYGFSVDEKPDDMRIRVPTDFAKDVVSASESYWWTRSPGYATAGVRFCARHVDSRGSFEYRSGNSVGYTKMGIVPALCLE